MNKKEIGATVAAGVAGTIGAVALLKKKARSICAKYKNDPVKFKACVRDVTHRDVLKKNKAGKRDLRARRSDD